MPLRYVPDLTCCRAAFAAWVFAYHLALQFGVRPYLLGRGYLGVDGFFLLSGMLLAHVHPALGTDRDGVAGFWAKRLARIYPVHLATIALMGLLLAGAALAGVEPRDPARFGGRELVLNLLLLHGWGLSARWAWNYPSWSVSSEWFGYLLFPFAWRAMRGTGPAAAAAVACAALALLFLVQRGTGLNLTYQGALWRLAPEFAAGMAAARLAPVLARRASGRLVAAAGLAWSVASLAAFSDAWVVPGLLLCLGGLLIAAIQGRAPLLARAPGLIEAGELSYAFYMSFAVVETVQALVWRRLAMAPADDPLAYVAFATLATLALAMLLRRFVERPGLRLATRLASV